MMKAIIALGGLGVGLAIIALGLYDLKHRPVSSAPSPLTEWPIDWQRCLDGSLTAASACISGKLEAANYDIVSRIAYRKIFFDEWMRRAGLFSDMINSTPKDQRTGKVRWNWDKAEPEWF